MDAAVGETHGKIRHSLRTLVHEKNMGSEAARNDALDVMKGQWVMFLDADDEYDA